MNQIEGIDTKLVQQLEWCLQMFQTLQGGTADHQATTLPASDIDNLDEYISIHNRRSNVFDKDIPTGSNQKRSLSLNLVERSSDRRGATESSNLNTPSECGSNLSEKKYSVEQSELKLYQKEHRDDIDHNRSANHNPEIFRQSSARLFTQSIPFRQLEHSHGLQNDNSFHTNPHLPSNPVQSNPVSPDQLVFSTESNSKFLNNKTCRSNDGSVHFRDMDYSPSLQMTNGNISVNKSLNMQDFGVQQTLSKSVTISELVRKDFAKRIHAKSSSWSGSHQEIPSEFSSTDSEKNKSFNRSDSDDDQERYSGRRKTSYRPSLNTHPEEQRNSYSDKEHFGQRNYQKKSNKNNQQGKQCRSELSLVNSIQSDNSNSFDAPSSNGSNFSRVPIQPTGNLERSRFVSFSATSLNPPITDPCFSVIDPKRDYRHKPHAPTKHVRSNYHGIVADNNDGNECVAKYRSTLDIEKCNSDFGGEKVNQLECYRSPAGIEQNNSESTGSVQKHCDDLKNQTPMLKKVSRQLWPSKRSQELANGASNENDFVTPCDTNRLHSAHRYNSVSTFFLKNPDNDFHRTRNKNGGVSQNDINEIRESKQVCHDPSMISDGVCKRVSEGDLLSRSKSVSHLPFKPFQLQKPNLNWRNERNDHIGYGCRNTLSEKASARAQAQNNPLLVNDVQAKNSFAENEGGGTMMNPSGPTLKLHKSMVLTNNDDPSYMFRLNSGRVSEGNNRQSAILNQSFPETSYSRSDVSHQPQNRFERSMSCTVGDLESSVSQIRRKHLEGLGEHHAESDYTASRHSSKYPKWATDSSQYIAVFKSVSLPRGLPASVAQGKGFRSASEDFSSSAASNSNISGRRIPSQIEEEDNDVAARQQNRLFQHKAKPLKTKENHVTPNYSHGISSSDDINYGRTSSSSETNASPSSGDESQTPPTLPPRKYRQMSDSSGSNTNCPCTTSGFESLPNDLYAQQLREQSFKFSKSRIVGQSHPSKSRLENIPCPTHPNDVDFSSQLHQNNRVNALEALNESSKKRYEDFDCDRKGAASRENKPLSSNSVEGCDICETNPGRYLSEGDTITMKNENIPKRTGGSVLAITSGNTTATDSTFINKSEFHKNCKELGVNQFSRGTGNYFSAKDLGSATEAPTNEPNLQTSNRSERSTSLDNTTLLKKDKKKSGNEKQCCDRNVSDQNDELTHEQLLLRILKYSGSYCNDGEDGTQFKEVSIIDQETSGREKQAIMPTEKRITGENSMEENFGRSNEKLKFVSVNSNRDIDENRQFEYQVSNLVRLKTDDKQFEKFRSYIDQLDKVFQLALKLSGRLSKIDGDISRLMNDSSESEKKQLSGKRCQLMDKLLEANDLKVDIDRRGRQMAAHLQKCLDPHQYCLFEQLIQSRSLLAVQMQALQEKMEHSNKNQKTLIDTCQSEKDNACTNNVIK